MNPQYYKHLKLFLAMKTTLFPPPREIFLLPFWGDFGDMFVVVNCMPFNILPLDYALLYCFICLVDFYYIIICILQSKRSLRRKYSELNPN